jgi:hypothetical protein
VRGCARGRRRCLRDGHHPESEHGGDKQERGSPHADSTAGPHYWFRFCRAGPPKCPGPARHERRARSSGPPGLPVTVPCSREASRAARRGGSPVSQHGKVSVLARNPPPLKPACPARRAAHPGPEFRSRQVSPEQRITHTNPQLGIPGTVCCGPDALLSAAHSGMRTTRRSVGWLAPLRADKVRLAARNKPRLQDPS